MRTHDMEGLTVLKPKPKAFIILSEGRSGTNYFSSRINEIGLMGKSDEWLDTKISRSQSFKDFYDTVVKLGKTENGNFAIKLFPRHIFHVNRKFGVDFIDMLGDNFDLFFLLLERKDRLAQAISFSRAMQSSKWKSTGKKISKEVYDFNQINRLCFRIDESYVFWTRYLMLKRYDYHHYYYEDILESDDIYITCFKYFSIDIKDIPASPLNVQRDKVSVEWRERYEADVANKNLLSSHRWSSLPKRSASNWLRFLRGLQIRPFPYQY